MIIWNLKRDNSEEPAFILVDSLLLVPVYDQFPIFDPQLLPSSVASNLKKTFENEHCLLNELQINQVEEISKDCERMTYRLEVKTIKDFFKIN